MVENYKTPKKCYIKKINNKDEKDDVVDRIQINGFIV